MQRTLAIKEMQTKTTNEIPLLNQWNGKIKETDPTKYWQAYKTITILIYCSCERKMVQTLKKTIWQFLIKITYTQFNPVIPVLGIYSREIKLMSIHGPV